LVKLVSHDVDSSWDSVLNEIPRGELSALRDVDVPVKIVVHEVARMPQGVEIAKAQTEAEIKIEIDVNV
jgi:hypothetical protein